MHVKISQYSIKTRLIVALLAGCLVISPCQWLTTDAHALPVAPALSIVFKAILKKALFVGLEKAGHYYMKSAWPYAKIVIEPIIEKFPEIISKDTAASKKATNEALRALDDDPDLLEAIEQRFNKLERGRNELIERVRVIEATLEDHEERIHRLEVALKLPRHEKLDLPVLSVTKEFYDAVRAFLNSARSDFQNIKGAELCAWAYSSKLNLPGASSCIVTIVPVDAPGPSQVECTIVDSDFHENVTPELIRFAYVELVEKIIASLPSSWKYSYPPGWEEIKGLRERKFGLPPRTSSTFRASEYPNQQGRGINVNYRTDTRSEEERKKPIIGGFSARDLVGSANRVEIRFWANK